MDFQNPAIVVITTAIITSIIAPFVMLLAQRYFTKGQDIGGYAKTLQAITEQAVDDLNQEKKDSKERDEVHKKEVQELKDQIVNITAIVGGDLNLTIKLPMAEIIKNGKSSFSGVAEVIRSTELKQNDTKH